MLKRPCPAWRALSCFTASDGTCENSIFTNVLVADRPKAREINLYQCFTAPDGTGENSIFTNVLVADRPNAREINLYQCFTAPDGTRENSICTHVLLPTDRMREDSIFINVSRPPMGPAKTQPMYWVPTDRMREDSIFVNGSRPLDGTRENSIFTNVLDWTP
jgi:hypothetical protein